MVQHALFINDPSILCVGNAVPGVPAGAIASAKRTELPPSADGTPRTAFPTVNSFLQQYLYQSNRSLMVSKNFFRLGVTESVSSS